MKKLMAFGIVGFVVVAIWAMTLPGALTKHDRTSFYPTRMRIERNAGTAAITETLDPPAAYKIHYIMVHFTSAASSGSLTIAVDSATSGTAADSAAHDYLLSSTALSSTTDVIWQPQNPYLLLGTDDIDVTANDQSTTWGITYCWEELN